MEGFTNKVRMKWYHSLSILHQWMGQNEKAGYYLEAMVKESGAGAKEWWTMGAFYGRMRQWEKASQAFYNAVRMSNGNPRYMYWLGRAQEEIGQGSMAEILYDETLKKDSSFWEALLAKGQLNLNRGQYKAALGYFEECLLTKPRDAHVLNSIGLCYLGLGQPESALQYVGEAVDINKNDWVMRYNYATIYVRLGNYKSAIEELKKIEKKDEPAVFSALGYCYGMLQQYQESIINYREALSLEPHNQEILLNLAAIYAKSGEETKALQLLEQLLLLNPYDADLLNNIAWIYETLNNAKEAETHYYRGLAVSGGNPQIAYNLICCLTKQCNYLEALELVEYLRNNAEWNNMAWSSLARIYERLGADRLAINCYNKALGLE